MHVEANLEGRGKETLPQASVIVTLLLLLIVT